MSVTYDEVRLARKRAYDRVRYELEKRSDKPINVGSAGFTLIPVPKHATQAELEYLYRYFTELRVENVDSYLSYEYEVHGIEKPTSIKNPYAREYRYKKSDEYFSSGYTPDEFFDDYELREQIYSDEADYESQVTDYEEEYSEPEPEPTPPEPEEDSWDDDDWWDADDWYDDDTAPDLVDYESAIIDNAYGINSEAGQAVEEALQSIKEQFENIGDMEKYRSGLESLFEDTYFWDNLQNTNKYRKQDGNIDNTGKSEEKILSEMNRALSKVYRHFGMSYYREY